MLKLFKCWKIICVHKKPFEMMVQMSISKHFFKMWIFGHFSSQWWPFHTIIASNKFVSQPQNWQYSTLSQEWNLNFDVLCDSENRAFKRVTSPVHLCRCLYPSLIFPRFDDHEIQDKQGKSDFLDFLVKI